MSDQKARIIWNSNKGTIVIIIIIINLNFYLFILMYFKIFKLMYVLCFAYENHYSVSQRNTDETKEDRHADSDEPCGMNKDRLGDPTEGTDDEDPLQEAIEGAHEEDSEVGKVMKLTVFSVCCIETTDR